MPEIFKPHELPLHTLRGQVLSACGEVLADCRREEIAAQRCQRTAQLFAKAPQLVEVLRRYFDYGAYGRDLVLGGDVWHSDGFYFWNR